MIFASSTQEKDKIKEILLRTGKITNDQYYQVAEIIKRDPKLIGKTFYELGFLKPQDLVQAVKYQTEEIILSLFCWEDGQIKFITGFTSS